MSLAIEKFGAPTDIDPAAPYFNGEYIMLQFTCNCISGAWRMIEATERRFPNRFNTWILSRRYCFTKTDYGAFADLLQKTFPHWRYCRESSAINPNERFRIEEPSPLSVHERIDQTIGYGDDVISTAPDWRPVWRRQSPLPGKEWFCGWYFVYPPTPYGISRGFRSPRRWLKPTERYRIVWPESGWYPKVIGESEIHFVVYRDDLAGISVARKALRLVEKLGNKKDQVVLHIATGQVMHDAGPKESTWIGPDAMQLLRSDPNLGIAGSVWVEHVLRPRT